MNTKRVVGVVAAGAVAMGGALVAAGAAQANPTDTNTCQAGEVTAASSRVDSPDPALERFAITFTAAEGQDCVLTGFPQDLIFYQPGGFPVGGDSVPARVGSENDQVLVDAANPANVHIDVADPDEPGAQAATATFGMLNSDGVVPFRISFPYDINKVVSVTSVTGG
ncbi:hypothetical protein [Actinokineospora pegani]|uniref:hypothetical protein n=1 Tax=Actinokineospora pegani TaxID=2654637 RepID=UPI0012EAC2C4|nr:hypothetical protein [Actinokineospora pegani]